MNRTAYPRVLLAGTASSTGKTTMTCAVLAGLRAMGTRVCAFKCGPDYIDPMFHSRVVGVPSRNLDLFMGGGDTARFVLGRQAEHSDLAVLEGVMGLFDGKYPDSDEYSSNHVARFTGTPTVLVVNVGSLNYSAVALIRGFRDQGENTISGVLLNQCSRDRYSGLKEVIERELGLPVYGFLPRLPGAEISSRHLGLLTADEVRDLENKIRILKEAALDCIDLKGLVRLSGQAGELSWPVLWEKTERPSFVRIGVARDRAFCFYYQDTLEMLEALGAELVEFSPLQDPVLPGNLDGLILGGGYPEEYACQLAENRGFLEDLKKKTAQGIPVLAECGGFMVLLETMAGRDGIPYPMAGVLSGKSFMTGRLNRFGYVELSALADNLLCRKGETLRGHEFHFSDSSNNGQDFRAGENRQSRLCIHAGDSLVAGYPHLYLAGKPEAGRRFLEACLVWRKRCQGC